MSGRRIAAFDFDGTLTRRDTLLPFLTRACGPRAVGRIASRVDLARPPGEIVRTAAAAGEDMTPEAHI